MKPGSPDKFALKMYGASRLTNPSARSLSNRTPVLLPHELAWPAAVPGCHSPCVFGWPEAYRNTSWPSREGR